jgi:hypothetical protein
MEILSLLFGPPEGFRRSRGLLVVDLSRCSSTTPRDSREDTVKRRSTNGTLS